MEKYNVAVVGAGMVGKKMVEILLERDFPCNGLPKILATRDRVEEIAGKMIQVEKTEGASFDNIDIALFAGTEGERGASKLFAREAARRGAVVIDNGGDFRMESDVPLVIPEVNPHHLKEHNGLIANPNCSTIQMVMGVFPLHREYTIKRIIVSTFQSVSGTGRDAVEELERQVRSYVASKEIKNEVYPHQIAFNAIPQIGGLSDEFPGYYSEEIKMIKETHKILGTSDIKISATCVRIPVFNGHSEAVTVQCEKKICLDGIKELFSNSSGIEVIDEPDKSLYPTPLMISEKDAVYIGRIRVNPALENALDMWIACDNIRKGAALNTIQIAEKMIETSLL